MKIVNFVKPLSKSRHTRFLMAYTMSGAAVKQSDVLKDARRVVYHMSQQILFPLLQFACKITIYLTIIENCHVSLF